MRPKDRQRAGQIERALAAYSIEKVPLLGIEDQQSRKCFLEQLMESVHRVEYVRVIRCRRLSPRRMDPNDEIFDPLRAAILHHECGNIDEAFWLVFLFVHFGKHPKAKWRYIREVYGCLGTQEKWNWRKISRNPASFRAWLHAHEMDIRRPGVPGGFGNHRKYQSLNAYSDTGTGSAVETYVEWVGPPRQHMDLFTEFYAEADGNPKYAFELLYRSMRQVASFGRTARFDYLTMVGKLGLAPIVPGSAYIRGSTGPTAGARLLFHADRKTRASTVQIETWLQELDEYLGVGMQVLEDALCNWQKSPRVFKPFRA